MNVSATISTLKLIRDPSLCLPHATIPTFAHLPVPLSAAFPRHARPDIRAVVLDKDNCFAVPRANEVYKPYSDKFQQLRAAYPGARLLIVSNSAGTDDDVSHQEVLPLSSPTPPSSPRLSPPKAALLEANTGVSVLRHSRKKPSAHPQILAHLTAETDVTHPSQIAVVGDRLFTDMVMANRMGAWGVWVKDGVVEERGLFTRAEKALEGWLRTRGYTPPEVVGPGTPFGG
ncbi:MAG: hypothetical protein M1832_003418 [Thelocarpon impressellum]|nr:MAG: hypothetical protein M1832_003418 [Thelocarpon impressellum]